MVSVPQALISRLARASRILSAATGMRHVSKQGGQLSPPCQICHTVHVLGVEHHEQPVDVVQAKLRRRYQPFAKFWPTQLSVNSFQHLLERDVEEDEEEYSVETEARKSAQHHSTSRQRGRHARAGARLAQRAPATLPSEAGTAAAADPKTFIRLRTARMRVP